MKKKIDIILLSFFILFLFSCNEKESKVKSENTENSQLSEQRFSIMMGTSADKKYHASLEINKSEVKKLEPVELKFKFLTKDKSKITGEISVDLTMPEMAMPKNEVKLKKTEGEIYSGIAIFTMKGKWVLKTKAEINNTNQSFDFEIQVN